MAQNQLDLFNFERDDGKKEIIFTKEVPRFIGVDMEIYGAFNKGDTCRIPLIHANNLLQKGAAHEIQRRSNNSVSGQKRKPVVQSVLL